VDFLLCCEFDREADDFGEELCVLAVERGVVHRGVGEFCNGSACRDGCGRA
jgi:hypothetical protein